MLLIVAALLITIQGNTKPDRTGRDLYTAACAACHGADGKGVPITTAGFETPLPDFSDCGFASREPDEDWLAVIHEGGPVRAFDRMMPAFGRALTVDELTKILGHIRTFCGDGNWPRGELNMPRPLITEKAYPEDEAVLAVSADATAVTHKLVYERRFGARNQIELVVPFAFREWPLGWRAGVGDVAISVKRAVFHNWQKGSIFSVAGEVVLPTGNRDKNFGSGATVFEPFVAFGQLLPAAGFVQAQAGFEILADRERPDEFFWRTAIGKTFVHRRFGRAVSPIVEFVAGRGVARFEKTQWDVAPQVQISLSTRQHVLLNLGARLPATNKDGRRTQLMFYLLWDWFDGGLFSGW